jgi:hypothetical protein|tara:strand:- start:392 stop:1381 length:990 start_codon:yes stop_codon:yes gene_type:complete
MFSFIKKVFTIKGVTLPTAGLKMPNLNVSMQTPTLMGWSTTLRLFWPKIQLSGSAVKIGTMASFVGLAIATGAYFLAVEGIEQAPTYPQAAVYDVGQDYRLNQEKVHVGTKNTFPDDMPQVNRAVQTLNLVVNGARIDQLNFDTISIGKATGLENAIKVHGAANGNNGTFDVACDTITIDGLEAPTFKLDNSEIHELIIQDNVADGLSVGSTLASVSDIEVGSTRGAINVPSAKDSTYDRIIINSSTASSICKGMTFKDIKVFGTYADGNNAATPAVYLSYVKAGKLIIKNSIVGDGTGIDSPSFIIDPTTKVTTLTATNNIERPTTIK